MVTANTPEYIFYAFISIVSCMLLVVAFNCYCILQYCCKERSSCQNSKCTKGKKHLDKTVDTASIDIEVPTVKGNGNKMPENSHDNFGALPELNNKEVVSDEDEVDTVKNDIDIHTTRSNKNIVTHNSQDNIDALLVNGNKEIASDEDEIEILQEIVTYPAKTKNSNENKKIVKCVKCEKMFDNEQGMRSHVTRVHRDGPLTSTRKGNIPIVTDNIDDIDIIEDRNHETFMNINDNTSVILQTETIDFTSLDTHIVQNETDKLSRNNKRRKSGKKRAQLPLTFECSQCGNKFASEHSLRQHNASKH